jgi:multidrug efflux pump
MNRALAALVAHPRSVLTVMLAFVLAGLVAYLTVPKEANPDIDIPIFHVSVTQQGISPEDAERLLVRPLETKLRGLDGLKEITGSASQGYGSVTLEFDVDFDKDAALADVRDKVDQAAAELPAEADEPRVFEMNFSLVPTIVVALSGNVPERTLYQHARRLKDQIEAIPSVLEADLVGQREELLEVVIDLNRLESYDITQEELLRAVTSNNRLVAAGSLDTGQGRFDVKVPGLIRDLQDVYDLPIKAAGDAVVTLADVAEIRRTFKDPTSFSRFNGEKAIAIEVKKRLGENIIANNQEVRRVVQAFTADWPEVIRVDFTLDQSSFIFEVLGSLQSSVFTAIALVMVMVVAALGLRSGILVGLAIPTSFLVGFLIVGLLGMTVNMMVMFGLVLTVGMLVDGAIVMIEYADRKMAEGLHRRDAYRLAAQRMFWPITSSTATTLAAFLPLLLWPGVAGKFMSFLPIMVIIILSASLLTALVFLPVLGALFGKSVAQKSGAESARALSGSAQVEFDHIPGMTGAYARLLRRLVYRPVLVTAALIALTAAIFYAYGQNSNGVEFFVSEEPDQAIVFVSARGNLSVREQRDLVMEVEREILAVDGIQNVFATIGGGSSGPKVGGPEDKPVDAIAQINLELADYCCRRTAEEIFTEIRARTADLAGMKIEIRKQEGGPPTGKDIRLQITAPAYDQVREATARVRQGLEADIAYLTDIEDTRPLPGMEWQLDVDRAEAGRFGADVTSVGALVQLITDGVRLSSYRPDDAEDEIDIRLRLPEDERSIDQLDQLKVRTANGLVPIANFVSREAQPKLSSITRKDGAFAMTVNANVADGVEGVDPTTKVAEIDGWLKSQDWPAGVSFRFRGADEEQKDAQAFLAKGAGAALFIMFVILVTQFNSFYQTVLTLATVVLAVGGVLLGMMVTGQKFSVIMTGTGIVALAGIVVNNAIVLMDTFNRLRGEGLDPIDAVLRTAAQRLRPILLTTGTTIMGLIPMATQVNFDFINRLVVVGGITSTWWVQLSTAIIFGLAFSTLLTLVLVPVLLALPHVYVQRWRRLRKWRIARRKAKRAAAQAGPDEAPEAMERPYAEAAE